MFLSTEEVYAKRRQIYKNSLFNYLITNQKEKFRTQGFWMPRAQSSQLSVLNVPFKVWFSDVLVQAEHRAQ